MPSTTIGALQPRKDILQATARGDEKCTVTSQLAIRIAAPFAAEDSVSFDITRGRPLPVRESALDASGIAAKAIANGWRMRCRLPRRGIVSINLKTYLGM